MSAPRIPKGGTRGTVYREVAQHRLKDGGVLLDQGRYNGAIFEAVLCHFTIHRATGATFGNARGTTPPQRWRRPSGPGPLQWRHLPRGIRHRMPVEVCLLQADGRDLRARSIGDSRLGPVG